jgi:formylglycine-generating enzyme required for sulfatase activity
MNTPRALLWLMLFTSVLTFACNQDDPADDPAADDDADDDQADDDDDSDRFEQDGVLIVGQSTNADGYVEFSIEGEGHLGVYLRDETLYQTPLPDIKVYLIVKDGQAAVLALDRKGAYLPFLADVISLATMPDSMYQADSSIFGQDYLLGMARRLNASADEPFVISTQISPAMLRVMLVFFFEPDGAYALQALPDRVDQLTSDPDTAKIVQFALFADPETATDPVPVTLAVFDRDSETITDFFPVLYQANCYAPNSPFELYGRDEPLADNSPASFQYLLAVPQDPPAADGAATLNVTVRDAVTTDPLFGARLSLAPVGMTYFTGEDGQAAFVDVPLCTGDYDPLFYLRASRYGYYPAQFAIADLVAGQTLSLTVSLSPTGPGSDTPAWVAIPAGSVLMGCSPNDSLCDADEFPAHTVQLSAFFMTETEITQAQYVKVMDHNPAWYTDCANCPVEMLTWAEARAFCQALGGRLPTEAQWEYAARAGATTRYYCGDDAACLDAIAWDKFNAGSRTHPARQKQPNAFGLYDVLGNVWEFTNDFYAADYYDQSPAQDPPGPAAGQYRVMRGGSWYSGQDNARVSNRFTGDPVGRYANFGFRCVK